MPTVHIKLESIGADRGGLPYIPPSERKGTMYDMLYGEDFNWSTRGWIARITGTSERYGFKRKFERPNIDYSEANSVGSRGVYKHYYLDEGGVYEISEPTSWKRTDRYFGVVQDADIIKIEKEEVLEWVKKDTSLLPF